MENNDKTLENIALIRGIRQLMREKSNQFDDCLKDYLDEDRMSNSSMKDLLTELERIRQEYLIISALYIQNQSKDIE